MLNHKKAYQIRLLREAAVKALEDKNLQYAYVLIKQTLNAANNESNVLETLITAAFNIGEYQECVEAVDKWIIAEKYAHDDSKAKMLYIKGKSYYLMNEYSKAAENLKNALELFPAHKDNESKIQDIKKILEIELPNKTYPPLAPEEERREEAAFVKKMLENPQLPDSVDKPVYILPMSWYERWQKYIRWDELFTKVDAGLDEEKERVNWLGPINPYLICDDSWTLVDRDPKEFYTNFQLRLGMIENKDFLIVNEELWNFLVSKYQGIPLCRYTYRKSPADFNISVEVWLQKINCFVVPMPFNEQPPKLATYDVTYISKRKTVKDLQKKLYSIYSSFFEKNVNPFKLWKLQPDFNLKVAWDRWNNGNFEIIGKEMNKEDVLIEEAEISDEDILIFEPKMLSNWFISNEDELTKYQKRKNEEGGSMNLSITDAKSFPPGAKRGLTGLQNLGNTCFMNSALQCLSNTYELTSYFLTNEFEKDINSQNPLGAQGKLAIAYSGLMKSMWLENSSSVSPWELKKTIGRLASQFVGYGQQDSQELLSYLLDGLHEDLNKIKKKPIIDSKDYDNNTEDHIIAAEEWENHLKRNKSKIQELMHGQFKSTLICPQCQRVSITCDPYMMLSVPIPNNEYAKFFVYFISQDLTQKIPTKATFNMISTTPYEEIREKVAQNFKVDPKTLVTGFLKEHKLVEFADEGCTAAYLKDHPGIVFCYEIPELTKIETEESKKIIIKALVQLEPKAFYDNEKTISYTRMVTTESNEPLKKIYIKIYEKMRHHINIFFTKNKQTSPINMEDKSFENLEKEYAILFNDDNESKWFYKLSYSVDGSKSKSKSLSSLDEDKKFGKFLSENGINENKLYFEIKISKNIKYEDLSLNQCTEQKTTDDDDNGNKNCTVYDCISNFTRKEVLEKGNEWYCNKCKAHVLASKKMELYRVPQILVVHLKRFKTSKVSNYGSFYFSQGSKKITVTVDFPLESLDLRSYVLGADKENAIYDLFAVSNHFGGMGGGHYTAFAKNQFDGKWYDFNDSSVHSAGSKEIVSAAAYVLFYRKRASTKL